MNSSLFFGIVSIATLVVMTSSAPSNTELNHIADVQQSGFILIGTFGEKAYFMNRTQSSWMAGEARCDSQNLKFSALKNHEEFRFISSNIEYADDLWIAASMRGMNTYESHKAFEYMDGTDVPNDINAISQDFSMNLCLYVSGSDHTYMASCTNGQLGVLCELTFGEV